MNFLQKFFDHISILFPFDCFRARAGAMLVLVAVFGIVLLVTPLANAGEATVTVTGTLTDGTDEYGTFVGAGGSLAGEDFTLVYTINDQLGAVTTTSGYSALTSTTTDNGQDASMTINNHTVQFSDHQSFGVPESTIHQNSPTKISAINLDWGYTYLGNAIGTAQANVSIGYANPVYTPPVNWESNFSYMAATTTDGTIQFAYSYGPDSVYTAKVPATGSFVHGYITTYTVTGPVTNNLPNVPAKNNGCKCKLTALSPPLEGGAHAVNLEPAAMPGDSINAATGNVLIQEMDFVGPAHTQLSFARYYNSYDLTGVALGKGWHSTWHRGLSVVGSTATVTAADGRQDTFTLSGGTWTGDADVTSVLTASGSNYKLTLPDDTVENYNSSGQLTSIVTRAGLTTTLTYTSGNLTKVTGPFGHTLTFTYDSLNRLATMKPTDGNTYSYSFDGFGDLSAVSYPTGYSRNYVYSNQTYRNLVTNLVDEDSNVYASWTYDSTGRALTSQHAGGADLTSIAYTTSTSSTVTDANSNTATYTLTTLFNVVKPTAVSGLPDPAGDAFTYDANGFIFQPHGLERQCDRLRAQLGGRGNLAHRSFRHRARAHDHHVLGRDMASARSRL
jgi:YD repeat-containing protein